MIWPPPNPRGVFSKWDCAIDDIGYDWVEVHVYDSTVESAVRGFKMALASRLIDTRQDRDSFFVRRRR
jgi:hypothetical protein